MDQKEWERRCCSVRDRMAEHVWPFVTPISESPDGSSASLVGTGSYVSICGRTYLFTNEHVAQEGTHTQLAHLPGPTDDYIACYNPFVAALWPIDIAVMRIGDEWAAATKRSIAVSALAQRYEPAEIELLFWIGFPGSSARRNESITQANLRHNWFGAPLETPAVPMLVQAIRESIPSLPHYDSNYHVAIHYPAKAIEQPDVPVVDLYNPKGMSGSLLWDTGYVAAMRANNKWSPSHARVCGILWAAHSKPEIIVITKIEHVRNTLLRFVREEAAYFHWLDRGSPLWEELIDWTWAENSISKLV